MSERKQVASAQPSAVGGPDPSRKQKAVRAVPRTPSLNRSYRQQLRNLRVAPRSRVGGGHLDTPQGSEYGTGVQQPLRVSELQEAGQHAAMSMHRGGREMSEGVGQIFVDQGGRKLADLPRQAAGENLQLVEVAWSSADPIVVLNGQIQDAHCAESRRGARTSPEGLYLRCARSSGGYGRVYGWLLWAANRRWPILRAVYLCALTLCVYLSAFGNALTLLVLGHVGRAFQELFADPMDR
jgi:hypothetical protein